MPESPLQAPGTSPHMPLLPHQTCPVLTNTPHVDQPPAHCIQPGDGSQLGAVSPCSVCLSGCCQRHRRRWICWRWRWRAALEGWTLGWHRHHPVVFECPSPPSLSCTTPVDTMFTRHTVTCHDRHVLHQFVYPLCVVTKLMHAVLFLLKHQKAMHTVVT